MAWIKSNWFFLLLLIGVAIGGVYSYIKYRVPPKVAFENLELVDLEGNSVSLSDYKGKNVFISFWASWCGDCIAEMPDLLGAQEVLADEDFVFLLVSDETVDRINAFIAKKNYPFKYLKSKNTHKEIDIHAIPTNYLLNKKGEVVFQKVMALDWDDEEVLNMLRDKVK